MGTTYSEIDTIMTRDGTTTLAVSDIGTGGGGGAWGQITGTLTAQTDLVGFVNGKATKITIGAIEPENPAIGDIWIDTT
jgi:hypothetical protein